MREKILGRVEITIQQFLWILLVQFLSDLFGLAIYYLLMFVFHGSVSISNLMNFGEYLANGVLMILFWMMMGWFTPRVCRPGLVGGLVTIVIWALTAFVLNHIVFLPWSQSFLEIELQEALYAIGYESARSSMGITLLAYTLLPAAYSLGLLLRNK